MKFRKVKPTRKGTPYIGDMEALKERNAEQRRLAEAKRNPRGGKR